MNFVTIFVADEGIFGGAELKLPHLPVTTLRHTVCNWYMIALILAIHASCIFLSLPRRPRETAQSILKTSKQLVTSQFIKKFICDAYGSNDPLLKSSHTCAKLLVSNVLSQELKRTCPTLQPHKNNNSAKWRPTKQLSHLSPQPQLQFGYVAATPCLF